MRLTIALRLGLALAASVLLAGPALAGTPFQEMDANKDGKITIQEYSKGWANQAEAQKNFLFLDANGDGVLTEADAKLVLRLLDLDGDGKLSKTEYVLVWKDPAQGQKSFEQFDRDHNGHLSGDEFMAPWPTIVVGKW